MGLLTQGVEVECGRSGAPVRVLWEGRVHSVAEEPVRWHRRRSWWVDGHRAPRDTEVVDQEMWRVQVRLSPRAALITLELVHTMETAARPSPSARRPQSPPGSTAGSASCGPSTPPREPDALEPPAVS